MPTIDLARIWPDDWREFREVRLASLAGSPEAFGSRYDDWVDADEQRWRARLAAVPLTVVARTGGETVGVACGAPSGDAVEVISMWVAPEQRGSGLAGRLLDHVVEWAAARGQGTYLMVREDNVRAIRSYARAGFVDEGVPEDWPAGVPRERRMVHGGPTAMRPAP